MRGIQRIAVVLVACVASPVPGQELTEKERGAIAAQCRPWARDDAPGISVAVVRGGQLVHASGHGLAQLEYDVPISSDTVFHVASVSKQFTAFALVLLAQDGKLSLDDDVRKHVPWLHDFGATITIRHLLNHTSGLRDQWELLAISGYTLEDVLTQDHILRILRNQRELNFAPGSEYLYCNAGYTLAAHIVEVVSGMEFPAFCTERIFKPLGMTSTHFHRDHRRVVPDRAYSYARARGDWQKSVLSYANVGATSLFTTAPDLARWLANLGSGEVGGREAVVELSCRGELTDGKTINYALGILTGELWGRPMLRHGGSDAGFRSEVLYFPEQDLGVVVLANGGHVTPSQIAASVARVLLPRKAKKPAVAQADAETDKKIDSKPAGEREEIELDAQTLTRILGRYGGDGQPEVIVRRAENGASVEIVGMGRGRLLRYAPAEFFVREAPVTFRFELGDGDGAAAAVAIVRGPNTRRADRVHDAPADPAARAAWAGRYLCPELEVFYEIVVDGDRVFARQRRHGDIPLEARSADVLVGRAFFFRTVRFERDADDNITGFRLSGGRVRNLRFERVE